MADEREKMETLIKKCKKCHGTGKGQYEKYPGGGNSPFPKDCPVCKGKGKVLTNAGKKIAEVFIFIAQ
jgi:DnaJ-class molecular chaperone